MLKHNGGFMRGAGTRRLRGFRAPGSLPEVLLAHKTDRSAANMCCAGARLDPTDPWVPFGATVKGADGEPLTSHDGPLDDPYGIAGGGGTAAASGGDGDEVAALGDGSLAAAEAAIEVIREGGRC
ncbi:hypothetical protein PLESTM_001663000 [Pleodorina starrii]|nr:hypothetical protein PLESTM_001663000 [Pleodorina starrii]